MPFADRDEYVASTTYGKVTEREDGTLVCKFTNPKYPEFVEESEMYYQLSIKTGKASWQSSERFWLYQENRYGNTGIRHPIGEFYHNLMIFQNDDMPDSCCDIEMDGANYGDTHRALCKEEF